jgi:protein gp37
MSKSEFGISWTDATWNPIVGCARISPGCDHCWAERMARLHYHADFPNGWNGHVGLFPGRLNQPLHWRKPRRIAVGLMGDLWHPSIPNNFIACVLGFAHTAKQHTFQFLTKRAERLPEFFTWFKEWTMGAWPREYPHVQIGVSCENQAAADERIPLLLQTPAAVRFVSCEPLLGPIDFREIHPTGMMLPGPEPVECNIDVLTEDSERHFFQSPASLDWVIVGGESGPGARPMHPDWARSLRDQCQAAGVPFHFKQWGEYLPSDQLTAVENGIIGMDASIDHRILPDGMTTWRLHKKSAGHLLDGREWLEFPENKQS